MMTVNAIPGNRISQDSIIYWDKLAHASEYFILGVLYLMMRRESHKSPATFHYLLLAIIFPIVEELHQLLIPMRSCSRFDVLADFIGITLAFLIYVFLKKQGKIRL